jgi:hypothetical protein
MTREGKAMDQVPADIKVGAVKNASYKMNETVSSRYYVTR